MMGVLSCDDGVGLGLCRDSNKMIVYGGRDNTAAEAEASSNCYYTFDTSV